MTPLQAWQVKVVAVLERLPEPKQAAEAVDSDGRDRGGVPAVTTDEVLQCQPPL